MHKRLLILGTRGVPAKLGDPERIAEELALYLIQKGWRITVYCQEEWNRTVPYETMWGRIRRVHIPIKQKGWLGRQLFALKAALHARKQPTLALTFGYDTAIFGLFQRLRGKSNIIHVGDVAFQAPPGHFFYKLWVRLNFRIACAFASHLFNDNPVTENLLEKRVNARRISTLTNGAIAITDTSSAPIRDLGLEPGKYSLIVAQATPAYSLLEMIQAFSLQPRGHQLVVVTDLDETDPYHQRIQVSASSEVHFVEALSDTSTLRALRYHCYCYLHGYRYGGTSPSLTESLAAGNPVIAFDTASTRWVTGTESALFFTDSTSCAQAISQLLSQPDLALNMKKAARLRHAEAFVWEHILPEYEKQLHRLNPYAPDPEGWEKYLDDDDLLP